MIKVYNRALKNYEIEKVAGDGYLKWIYSSSVGLTLLELFVKKKFFSWAYGKYCDSPFSKKNILSFINEFNIETDSFLEPIENYKCFNDFFTRQLKTSYRPMDMNKDTLISPADGRLLVYENIDSNSILQVKGFNYSLSDLITNDTAAKEYDGGTALVFRLCPTDYHRFHFIDSGIADETNIIKGNYYSVNPIALEKIPRVFCQNKREWSIFYSNNFGDIIYVEVGATCVGSIIQSYKPHIPIKKGEEKGFFKFGGSTTILLFKPSCIKIDEDIIKQSMIGYETHVLMGETIGKRSDR